MNTAGRLVHWLGIGASISCLGYVIYQIWATRIWQIETIAGIEALSIILFGSLIAAFAGLFLAESWFLSMRWLGDKLAHRALCYSIYGRTQIAKYLPGNVFHFAGRQIIGSQCGLSNSKMFGALCIEILGLAGTAAVIASFSLQLFILPEWLVFIAPILAILVLIISPVLLLQIFRRLPPRMGFVMPTKTLKTQVFSFFRIYTLHFCQATCLGLCLWLIMIAINAGEAPSLQSSMAIAALAWVVGFVIPGASAGAGIREATLIFLLSSLIGEPNAVISAVVLRVITLLGDALFFIFSVIVLPSPEKVRKSE